MINGSNSHKSREMAKDEKVKNNRLAQLFAVSELADRLGDLSKLVIK